MSLFCRDICLKYPNMTFACLCQFFKTPFKAPESPKKQCKERQKMQAGTAQNQDSTAKFGDTQTLRNKSLLFCLSTLVFRGQQRKRDIVLYLVTSDVIHLCTSAFVIVSCRFDCRNNLPLNCRMNLPSRSEKRTISLQKILQLIVFLLTTAKFCSFSAIDICNSIVNGP